ncbi:MAG: class I SAM-dependent methyltransferase [Candidatus Altiarchaeota archaeon]
MNAFSLAEASVDTRIRRRWVRRAIEAKGKKVLDCGCGVGIYSKDVLVSGGKAFGIDAEKTLVEQATMEIGKKFGAADAINLPFRPGSFEIVLLTDVLEHLDEPGKALTEIHKVLSLGGSLIITVPHKNMQKVYDFLSMKKEEHGHLRLYDEDMVSSQLDACGYKINFIRRIQSPIAGLVGMAVAKIALWKYGDKKVRECQMTVETQKNTILSLSYVIVANILYMPLALIELASPQKIGTELLIVAEKRD